MFFERGIGTDTVAFASLHDQPGPSGPTDTNKRNPKGFDVLTVLSSDGGLGSTIRQAESQLKRSQGMFRHPAMPASLCGLVLPIVLAYLISAKTIRERILFFLIYAWGFVALLLTFSRAGFIGFIAGTLIFFVVGGRTGFISRRVAVLSSMTATLLVIISMPLLLVYLETRPDTFFMRFRMFEVALKAYSDYPLLGVGLNNDTAAMKESRQELRDFGIPVASAEPADSYYLAIFDGDWTRWVDLVLWFLWEDLDDRSTLDERRWRRYEATARRHDCWPGGPGYSEYCRWTVSGPRCQRHIMAFCCAHFRHPSL